MDILVPHSPGGQGCPSCGLEGYFPPLAFCAPPWTASAIIDRQANRCHSVEYIMPIRHARRSQRGAMLGQEVVPALGNGSQAKTPPVKGLVTGHAKAQGSTSGLPPRHTAGGAPNRAKLVLLSSRVTVHGAARTVFSAPCEGDSLIFAAETVDHWAKTPFVPRKLGQSPCERLPPRYCCDIMGVGSVGKIVTIYRGGLSPSHTAEKTATATPRTVAQNRNANAQPLFGKPMKSLTEYLTLNVPNRMDFVNMTHQVEEAVQRSGVQEGLCLVNTWKI